MAHRNYKNGADKERRIVKKFRDNGCLAFRSAGSHSPIDCFILDTQKHEIKLIQSKIGYLSPKQRGEIMTKCLQYEGDYKVVFELWD